MPPRRRKKGLNSSRWATNDHKLPRGHQTAPADERASSEPHPHKVFQRLQKHHDHILRPAMVVSVQLGENLKPCRNDAKL